MTSVLAARAARQAPTECADGSMTLWMQNSNGQNPCALVQDVLRVCQPTYELGFLPRGYTCDNSPGSALAPCCCGSPTFALMSACWSCQYNITFDLVSTTFTGFEKNCQTLPDPITTYDTSVRSSIQALSLPAWAQVEPLAGKWDFAGAWKNATPDATSSPPVPTGYPVMINSTGISKGALAGAIVGAILGSKILFMGFGYIFWRWWKKQPGHNQEDDEKGYVHRVLGEPKPGRRIGVRSRRGSRARVDLDEDTSTSPRSSRWLGVPSYLHPTSFHSHSSASESSHAQHHNAHALVAEEPRYGMHDQHTAGVTPFVPGQRAAESEKRRQSISMRIANDTRATGGSTEDGHEGAITAPQPALLARARTMSTGRNPTSPLNPSRPPMLNAQSRSNSQANSHSTSNLHGHTDSPGSSSRRYQEDDAGVSLVIEGADRSAEAIRSVPPAYVDYRSSMHELLGRHGSANTAAGSSREGGTSGSGTGEGSRSAGSEFGMDGLGSGAGTSASASSTLDSLASAGGKKEEQPELQQIEQTEQDDQTDRNEQTDADTVDARTMTDANTLRAGSMVNAEGHDDSETRDRTTSGDSEGASTIKATESLAEGSTEPHPPVTRSSTTDLAALTAANTAANRSAGPSTPVDSRPSAPTHQSAPMIAITTPEGGEAQGADNGVGSSSEARHTPPSTDEGHSPTPSTWSWSRAMGVLGMNPSGSGSNPDSGARTPKA